MKTKLLKKLRKEIISNADICMCNGWSATLCTILRGVKYYGKSHSMLAFEINAEKVGKEVEHVALKGYIESKRRRNKL